MNFTDAFNALNKADREFRRKQDIDDLNREMSGVGASRLRRFVEDDQAPQSRRARKESDVADIRTALDIMMQNERYAALWQTVENDLRSARRGVESLQHRIETAITRAKDDMAATLAQAVTLPDGRKAFLDEDGSAWTQDGEPLDPAIAAGIDWTDRPTREEYLQQAKRLEQLEALDQDNRKLSLRLGDISNHVHDENDPASLEDLERYREEIEDISRSIGMTNEILQNLETGKVQPPAMEVGDYAVDVDAVPKL